MNYVLFDKQEFGISGHYISFSFWWVSVNSVNKVSDDWIRDLKFNPHPYKKLLDVLVWW